IRDEGTRKLAESEMQRVKDAFTPDNMLAGAEILKSLSDVLKLRGRKGYFTRYGYIAWVSAYAPSGGQPDKVKIGDPAGTRPRPDAKPKPGNDTAPKTKPEAAAYGCGCGLPVPVAQGTNAPALIVVQVPEGARLWVDDYLTRQE